MKKGFAHKFEVWLLERCRNLSSGNLCIEEGLFLVVLNGILRTALQQSPLKFGKRE